MANLKIVRKHSLEKAEAKNRLKSLIKTVSEQNSKLVRNFTLEWNADCCDFSMTAMGFNIEGQMNVGSEDVTLDIQYPFLAKPFTSKIETMAAKELDNALC